MTRAEAEKAVAERRGILVAGKAWTASKVIASKGVDYIVLDRGEGKFGLRLPIDHVILAWVALEL